MTASAPTFGIGTASFIPGYGLRPGACPDLTLMRAAVAGGVRYLDTAAAYGAAEHALGELSDELIDRGVRICTKVAVPAAPGALSTAVVESRARLRRSAIDTVLLHTSPAAAFRSPEIDEQCRAMTETGLVGHMGASTYGVSALAAALDAPWCDVVQFEYSILNPSVWPTARAARRAGQTLVARSVLCKGMLTANWRHSALAAPCAGALGNLEGLAQEWGLSLPALAIRFALDTPGIDVVVVGVASEEELNEALAARDCRPLSAEQLRQLGAFDQSERDAAHPERWAHV